LSGIRKTGRMADAVGSLVAMRRTGNTQSQKSDDICPDFTQVEQSQIEVINLQHAKVVIESFELTGA
jgi:hypothetical protein